MRCDDHTFIGEEGLVEVRGFRVEDIQGEAANLLLIESVPGGVVIDQAATGGVDHDGMAWHCLECPCVDKVPVVCGQWAVERDDVTGAEQFVQWKHRALGSVVDLRETVGDHVESEGAGPWHDCLCDSAEADESKLEAGKSPECGARRQIVFSPLGPEVEKSGFSQGGEHQGDGVVGYLGDAIIRDECDRDTALGARCDGDVVQADTKASDDLAAGCGGNDGWRDLGPAGGDRVGLTCQPDQSGLVGRTGLDNFSPDGSQDCPFDLAIGPGTVCDQDSERLAHLVALGVGRGKFRHADGRFHHAFPVLSQVVVGATLLGYRVSNLGGLDHLDSIPRADQQFVRI